ncbi:MAG: MBL fold metallo-hydrolase [Bacilli bacterium]|nr:MBL fold metallo-hydrolase [Bacilli bacterium]
MKDYWKYILIVIALLIVILGSILIVNSFKKIDDNDLKIYFFNAGKADACIISINGKYMMIDTGEKENSNEIIQYLKNNKIEKLDYLIITHFDKDHVGGAAKILESVQVDKVFDSTYPKESEEYNDYISALIVNKITAEHITDKRNVTLEGLDITVIGTDSIFDNNESNNSSLVVGIKYKNNSFLFTGDMQNARIKEYLNDNKDAYDFIKIPYHGHYMKRLDDLLETVKPKYAVITSSDKEKEDDETINLLRNLGIKYYLTREGSITVRSNGNYIEINQ